MRIKKDGRKRENGNWIERLRNAGFESSERGANTVLAAKNGCAAVIEMTASGPPHIVERPGLLLGGEVAHLLDRGFQKYWQTGSRMVPAAAAQLKALHQFEEELREALGLESLYNQSLGTVSSRYVYDRLENRE